MRGERGETVVIKFPKEKCITKLIWTNPILRKLEWDLEGKKVLAGLQQCEAGVHSAAVPSTSVHCSRLSNKGIRNAPLVLWPMTTAMSIRLQNWTAGVCNIANID